MLLKLTAADKTDVGKQRDQNEDYAYKRVESSDNGDRGLFIVADGMGGYEHGGVASTTALETFFDTFYAGHPSKPSNNMRQGIQAANLAVYQQAQRMGARMGTTLTAINLIGSQLHIAHIGDSRIYLIRGRKSTCLTNDHTAVGELVRMKILSPDKVRSHERRSVLEKCLGMQLFIQPDIIQHTLQQDDYLVLCTDGIWAHVEDHEFAEIALDIRAPELIGQTLLDLALSRNSDDNVSAMVIHVEQTAEAPVVAASNWGLSSFIRSKFMGRTG